VNVFLWGQLSILDASICQPIVRLNLATSHAPLFELYITADWARSDVFTLLHFTILAVHPSLHISSQSEDNVQNNVSRNRNEARDNPEIHAQLGTYHWQYDQ
jgi:hypothetical protein